MPLYDYECVKCGNSYEFNFKVADLPDNVECSRCGGEAKKVLIPGHGGIQCDSLIDVSWLASATKVLQPDGERPLQTRGEYNRYLKDKNIQPKA